MIKFGQQVVLKCFDTDEFMSLSKAKPNVIMILASTLESLEDTDSFWIPEVLSKWKNVPLMLVGSKSDTCYGQYAEDFHEKLQTFVHRHANVVESCEISAASPGGGVNELFDRAIILGMTCSNQLGPFFDGIFKVLEYVGVVKDNKHYRAKIEQVSPNTLGFPWYSMS